MKSKLFALMLLAGASAFAQSRFSISIGGYAPGYYGPPPTYYGSGSGYYDRGWGNPEREHRRAEQYGLRNHQQAERFMYGGGPDLWQHQMQEHRELRHEQQHERYEDFGAGYGPAHGSARDGSYGR